MTTILIDNTDVYEERIKDDKYLFKGEYLPLKVRNETIYIKGRDPVTIQIRSTHHGPLLDPKASAFEVISTRLYSALPKGYFSLAWVGLNPEEDNSFVYMHKAVDMNNTHEVIEGITGHKSNFTNTRVKDLVPSKGFTQNIMVADVHGNIGLAVCGTLVKSKLHPV
jgi:penicillin amidase